MANDPRFEVFPQKGEYPRRHTGIDDSRPFTEYRWRFRAANGQIAATSGEGFTRREDAHRAVNDLCDALVDVLVDYGEGFVRENYGKAPIIDVED